MTLDPGPYRKLAAALVLDAVASVKDRAVPKQRKKELAKDYRARCAAKRHARERDIRWFADRRRSGPWIEMAGLEWDGVTRVLAPYLTSESHAA